MEATILEIAGAEEIGIMVPVSICMFLVVLLVRCTNPHGSNDSPMQAAVGLIYMEKSSDSVVQKFEGALMIALVSVAVVAGVTFLNVLLYYYRCIRFLKVSACVSAFIILASMGGPIFVIIVQVWSIPVDAISFSIFLFNFIVLGVLSIFLPGMPIVMKQTYLVVLSIVLSYWLTTFPEWTTWVLLVALAVYDLVAVLVPGGPLNLLLDLIRRRGDEIPALFYESRPAFYDAPYFPSNNSNVTLPSERDQAFRRQVTSETLILPSVELQPQNSEMQSTVEVSEGLTRLSQSTNLEDGISRTFPGIYSLRQDFSISPEGRFEHETVTVPTKEASPSLEITRETSNPSDVSIEETIPTREASNSRHVSIEEITHTRETSNPSDINHTFGSDGPRYEVEMVDVRTEASEEISTSSTSRIIELGLGDFVFYSVLVGRAAMYDLMTVYACYLAVISGLGCTLGFVAVYERALPALPISISLGFVFYVLARLLMEPLVVGLSTKLLMF